MHRLIDLPYAIDALLPYMDAQTVEIHHSKHHQAYINKLNDALEKHPEFLEKSIEDLLKDLSSVPEDIRTAVKNNAGGVFAHNLFWNCMSAHPQKTPSEKLKNAMERDFSSFEIFKEKFSSLSQNHFASGWIWLCLTPEKTLTIEETPDHETPLKNGLTPILVLDVWEHAYYLKHQNRRADFINDWWNLVDFEKVEDLYQKTMENK